MTLVLDGARIAAPTPFIFFTPPKTLAMQPALGPVLGGTTVEVRGRYFQTAGPAYCEFGDLRVAAIVLSNTQLACVSPAWPFVGQVEFRVENSVDSLLFEYEYEVRIDEVSPTRGPSEGGSHLLIRGEHFSRRAAHLGTRQYEMPL